MYGGQGRWHKSEKNVRRICTGPLREQFLLPRVPSPDAAPLNLELRCYVCIILVQRGILVQFWSSILVELPFCNCRNCNAVIFYGWSVGCAVFLGPRSRKANQNAAVHSKVRKKRCKSVNPFWLSLVPRRSKISFGNFRGKWCVLYRFSPREEGGAVCFSLHLQQGRQFGRKFGK